MLNLIAIKLQTYNRMKKIVVIIDSKDNIAQCQAGLRYLQEQINAEQVDPQLVVHILSCKLNKSQLICLLEYLVKQFRPDVIIAGSSGAECLAADIDASLRADFQDLKIPVFGVGFTQKDDGKNNMAARLCNECSPQTQVVFNHMMGQAGFLNHCVTAVTKPLPALRPVDIPGVLHLTLDQALELARKKATN